MADRTKTLKMVDFLIRAGVLEDPHRPEYAYWAWKVLTPDYLPRDMKFQYQQYGEVRLYWI